jgi:hypothetical protein
LLQTVFVTALLFLIAEDLSFSQSPPAIINVFNPQVKIIGSTENKKQDSNYLNVHLKEQDTVFVSAKNKSADLKMIPPEKTRFVTGDRMLICGTYVKKNDLRELGVSFFDGNEIDKPVYTPGEGWVHYIMNPNWNGIIIKWEGVGDGKVRKDAGLVFQTDGKIELSTAINDPDGFFAILDKKGITFRENEKFVYINLVKVAGIKEIPSGSTIEITQNTSTGKKGLKIICPGLKEPIEIPTFNNIY